MGEAGCLLRSGIRNSKVGIPEAGSLFCNSCNS
jgi:hypothetical protein